MFPSKRHHGNTIAFHCEGWWQWLRNECVWLCVFVVGGREGDNSNSLSSRLLEMVNWRGGQRRHGCYYLLLLHPPINPSSHSSHTHMDFSNFGGARNNPLSDPFFSWEKLMDLNCITGRHQGPKGASKPGEGGTEMEFWLNKRRNNTSPMAWGIESFPYRA